MMAGDENIHLVLAGLSKEKKKNCTFGNLWEQSYIYLCIMIR